MEELGCTLTPSANIRKSLEIWGTRSFDPVHSYPDTIPWRCLATCPRIEGCTAFGVWSQGLDWVCVIAES